MEPKNLIDSTTSELVSTFIIKADPTRARVARAIREHNIALQKAAIEQGRKENKHKKYLRKFSRMGPCIEIGLLVRETPDFFVYLDDRRDLRESRIKKTSVHVEPCKSCVDHDETLYPLGYEG